MSATLLNEYGMAWYGNTDRADQQVTDAAITQVSSLDRMRVHFTSVLVSCTFLGLAFF